MTSISKRQFKLNHLSANDASLYLKNDDKTKIAFDNININNLGLFYNKDDSSFKTRIDKLNVKFYLETDKFLNHQHELEKSKDNLFNILFKQISIHVEEIERLNYKIKEKEDTERFTKLKMEEISKKENTERDINYYKTTIRKLEKKTSDFEQNEQKLKRENDSYKRQLLFYQDKLQLDLNSNKLENNFTFKNLLNTVTNTNLKRGQKEKLVKSNLPDYKSTYANLYKNTTNSTKKTNSKTEANNDNYLNVLSLSDKNLANLITNEANPIELLKNDKLVSVSLNNYLKTDNETNNTLKNKTTKMSPINRNLNLDNYREIAKKKIKQKNNNHNLSLSSRINSKNKSNYLNPELSPTKEKLWKKNSNATCIIHNTELNYHTISLDNEDLKRRESQPINEIQVENEELNEFANLFCQNINEELELLNQEETVLLYLRNDLLIQSGSPANEESETKEGIPELSELRYSNLIKDINLNEANEIPKLTNNSRISSSVTKYSNHNTNVKSNSKTNKNKK